MYRINFYVPIEHVKSAMFAAGAGRIGLYEQCCFEYRGQGQFKPLSGSDAFIGEVGQLETVEELKIEMVCEQSLIKQVLQAMIKAHPYEEPAYDVYKAKTLADFS